MKKLVVLLTLVATVSAFSQGQIAFNNNVASAGVSAPVSYDGTGPAPAGRISVLGTMPYTLNGTALDFGGKFARAALYYGHVGDAESTLSILTPSVPFKSGSQIGFVDVTSVQGGSARTLPTGYPAGSAAIFQIRAWDTGAAGTAATTFEQGHATILAQGGGYEGVSGIVTINALTVAPTTPGALVGLQPWTVTWVPEPSIIGLGILGAIAGLVVFRRRE